MTEPVTRIDPERWLQSEAAGAMDFLNGVAERFPHTISLAAGRPPDDLLGASRIPQLLEAGVAYEAQRNRMDHDAAWRRFGQYSDTNGIILPVLARLLERTEEIDVDGLSLQVTNGIQEALLIECLRAASEGGAAIAFDPAYVGMAGAAAVAGLPLYVTPRRSDPIAALAEATRRARRDTGGPLLCYVVADHDNPSALTMSLTERKALVALAADEGLLILEDTAYRLFNYQEERTQSLLSLDQSANVVHMVSFSKTFMPGLRFGFTARQGERSAAPADFSRLTSIKSFTSVLTSPLVQATVCGFLEEIDFDLDTENQARRARCRQNRDVLLSVLSENLGEVEGVHWTAPLGGFFITVRVPFAMRGADAIAAAEENGVLTVPMQLFSPTGSMGDLVRLSFSTGSAEQIAEGGRRFSAYVRSRLAGSA